MQRQRDRSGNRERDVEDAGLYWLDENGPHVDRDRMRDSGGFETDARRSLAFGQETRPSISL